MENFIACFKDLEINVEFTKLILIFGLIQMCIRTQKINNASSRKIERATLLCGCPRGLKVYSDNYFWNQSNDSIQ